MSHSTPRSLLAAVLGLSVLAGTAGADFISGSRTATLGNSTLGAEGTAYAGVENAPPAKDYLGSSNYLRADALFFGSRYEAFYGGAYAWVRPKSSSSDIEVRLGGSQLFASSSRSSNSWVRDYTLPISSPAIDIPVLPGLFSVRVAAEIGAHLEVDVHLTSVVDNAFVSEYSRAWASAGVSGGISVLGGLGAAGLKATGIFLDTEFSCILGASSSRLFGNAWLEFRPVRLILSFWWEFVFWGDEYVIGDWTWLTLRFDLIDWDTKSEEGDPDKYTGEADDRGL